MFALVTPGQIRAMESIGSRLKEARGERGLSQAALGKKAGLGQSAVGNIEAGLSNGAESLHKLAAVLGYSLRWLETGRGPKLATPTQQMPALGDMLAELARAIAAQPRTKRLQLQTLLADLAATPDARAETCDGIMELLEPGEAYEYTATWEELARELGATLGPKLLSGREFIAEVDRAHGAHVVPHEVKKNRKSSP